MTALKIRACAKLNLILNVTGRRPDGYHDLSMIMQSVDLCDSLTVSLGGQGIAVDCGELSGEDNLAHRAALRYCEAAGYDGGVSIAIDKAIPVSGGMGGGSVDAAAVLAALDRLIGGLSRPCLEEIALSLGADVPFALVGGTALAEGIGERLRPLPPLPDCRFLLVRVGVKESTGAMFARLDECAEHVRADTEAVVAALETNDLYAAAKGFGNAFDPLWDNELSRFARRAMLDAGALSATVTGAGPTLFGVFPDEASALRARSALAARCPSLLCRPTRQSLFIE